MARYLSTENDTIVNTLAYEALQLDKLVTKYIYKAVAMKGLTLSLYFGSGKNFGFGWKFYDRAKILGLGEKFMFRLKFWV